MFVVIRCYKWNTAYPTAAVFKEEADAQYAARQARELADIEWVTVMPVPHETLI